MTGGEAGVVVTNAGTIRGAVALGGGSDAVLNSGTIAGSVTLGAGNDTYIEEADSVAAHGVDGGEGTDLYRVVLAGDRSGIGARSNFERLAVDGTGTLSLTLDQDYKSVALQGTGLSLKLGGFSVGRIEGSSAGEQVSVDGDVAAVSLGAGDDTLSLGTTSASGHYDGGDGTDRLRFTEASQVTFSGEAKGFETVAANGDLTIAAGATLTTQQLIFGSADSRLVIAGGFGGSIDGGRGRNNLAVTGGNAAKPVTFANISNVEALTMSAGFATVAGRANLGSITLDGGRLAGLSGSSLVATTITVGRNRDLRLGGHGDRKCRGRRHAQPRRIPWHDDGERQRGARR